MQIARRTAICLEPTPQPSSSFGRSVWDNSADGTSTTQDSRLVDGAGQTLVGESPLITEVETVDAPPESITLANDGEDEVETAAGDTSQESEKRMVSELNSQPTSAASGEITDPPAAANMSTFSYHPGTNRSTTGTIRAADGSNPFLSVAEDVESVVYVVDVSGSMADGELERVLHSLEQALDALNKQQRFLVLFFNDGMRANPAHTMLAPATAARIDENKVWFKTMIADEGTDPWEAMQAAIGQNPKLIVLLSDGEFDPLSTQQITLENHRQSAPIRIDTIGLGEIVPSLQTIARSNGGSYFQAR